MIEINNYIKMRSFNDYILEKLHLNKNTKCIKKNPYKGQKFDNIISDIMYQIYRTSMDFSGYTVEAEDNNKVTVKIESENISKYPSLRDKIFNKLRDKFLDELGEYYNMNIYWRSEKMIIEYEELEEFK
jgi:hypothetical protein